MVPSGKLSLQTGHRMDGCNFFGVRHTILKRHIRPALKQLKIYKRIGWHTFRHGLANLLRQNKVEIKTVQEFLRTPTAGSPWTFISRLLPRRGGSLRRSPLGAL